LLCGRAPSISNFLKYYYVNSLLGGGIALWYSAIFPEQVEKLVTIDLISFGSLSLQKHVKASRQVLANKIYTAYCIF
jgi:hypothetical protein